MGTIDIAGLRTSDPHSCVERDRAPSAAAQLMTECRVLCLKSALRLERRGEQGQQEAEQRDHCR